MRIPESIVGSTGVGAWDLSWAMISGCNMVAHREEYTPGVLRRVQYLVGPYATHSKASDACFLVNMNSGGDVLESTRLASSSFFALAHVSKSNVQRAQRRGCNLPLVALLFCCVARKLRRTSVSTNKVDQWISGSVDQWIDMT